MPKKKLAQLIQNRKPVSRKLNLSNSFGTASIIGQSIFIHVNGSIKDHLHTYYSQVDSKPKFTQIGKDIVWAISEDCEELNDFCGTAYYGHTPLKGAVYLGGVIESTVNIDSLTELPIMTLISILDKLNYPCIPHIEFIFE